MAPDAINRTLTRLASRRAAPWKSKTMKKARRFGRVMHLTDREMKRLAERCDRELRDQGVDDRHAALFIFSILADAKTKISNYLWDRFNDQIDGWLRDASPEQIEQACATARCCPPLDHDQNLRRRQQQPGGKI